jgi:hypothetical protein
MRKKPPTIGAVAKTRRTLPARYALARKARDAVVSIIPRSHLPDDPGEIIGAALQQALTTAYAKGDLQSIHPMLLEAADRKRRELMMLEQTHVLTLRKLEAQVRFYENREAALAAELNKPTNQELTSEDLRRIRRIYGLDDQKEPPAEHNTLLDAHHTTDEYPD